MILPLSKVNIFRIGALLFGALILLFNSSCKDKPQADPCLNNYELQPLLIQYADSLIQPSYAELQEDLQNLEQSIINMQSNADLSKLQEARSLFREAYNQWQFAAIYEFGPAETHALRNRFNNFPLNESQARAKIDAEDYDFSDLSAYAQGLPAIDFILSGLAEQNDIVIDSLNGNPKYLAYAKEVIVHLNLHLTEVISEWSTYREGFISSTGTAAGESISLLVNAINEHFEFIKRNKIGIPSGALSLGFTNPTEVEAFYSGFSVELAESAIKASEAMFKGRSGEGLEELLRHVGAEKNNLLLADLIINQYSEIRFEMGQIDDPLKNSVDQQTDQVLRAFNSLNQQVIHLKSDMPSVLCTSITYVDNPSDSD
ncbi:imelysin family protein [bacterium]|nr:imelysin family protein [bacterium]